MRPHPPLGWLDAAVVAGSAVSLGAAATSARDGSIGVLCAVVAVFLGVWAVRGRGAQDGGPGWVTTTAVTVGVCAVGAWISPAFATFQIIAFPLAWLLTPSFRSALVANAVIAIAVGTGYALTTSVPEALVVEAVSVGFSIAMGVWITRIARQSAERQVLVERLTVAQAEVAALSREAGTVAERERLARELHDTLAQSLAGVVMLAERARGRHPQDGALGVLEDAARQALTEARGLVTAGANVPLEGGLAAALQTLAARFHREARLEVAVEVGGEVPRGLEVVLLRCAQEALANVRKHAAARAVRLVVTGGADEAVLVVADDGRGPGDGQGFGIAGMRDRLALVGGSVELTGVPGGGTTLTARVPMAEAVTA